MDIIDPTIITDQILQAYYYTYVLKNHKEHKSIYAVHE